MKSFLSFFIFLGIMLSVTLAGQKEANEYMKDAKLFFNDKYCTKIIQKQVFSDCYLTDLNTSGFDDAKKEKCRSLENERQKCIKKHKEK